MDRWRGKVAIVTGASAGIGAAIAVKLVDEGLHVVALARRKEKLDELAKSLEGKPGKMYPLQVDIRKEEDILNAFAWTKENLGCVNILVNNAGTGRPTTLLEGTTEDFRSVLETNVLGLTVATREAVNEMLRNKVDGHIIHMNSIMGHYVPMVPTINVYPATKHAITDTLRGELLKFPNKIKVTSISPGYVETEFLYVNGYVNIGEVASWEKNNPSLESEDVADAVIYVLGTPPHVQVTELTLRPVGEKI